jgi:hypothetical protein
VGYKHSDTLIQEISDRVKEEEQVVIVEPSKPIFTNDLKKGDIIIETNGWVGEVWDNAKGNTRVCNVYGYFTEAGSIYAWDIAAKYNTKSRSWERVTITQKQRKAQKDSQWLNG